MVSSDTTDTYLELVNEMNQTTDVNGDTVTIRGESFVGFHSTGVYGQSTNEKENNFISPYSSLAQSILEQQETEDLGLLDSKVTSLSSYSGNNFSIEYPDSWEAASISQSDGEVLVGLSSDLKLLLSFWAPDAFQNTDLPTLVDDTITHLINTSYIDLKDTDIQDISIAGSPGKMVMADYSQEYTPLIIEYKLKRQGDNYYLVEIAIYEAENTQTVSVKEKAYLINNNNDLYFASYSGQVDYFDLEEGNKILNSLTFK
ncbi:hypothetical protein ACTWKD_11225 [Halanaerobium saccharolyticum]|uniref:hypothetical protein n=1 Tax=Halanaerobium saccharolyticum TaxID=43595 RepID=UPI003FCDF120